MAAYSHLDRPKTSSISAANYALNRSESGSPFKWGATTFGTAPTAVITWAITSRFDGPEFFNPDPITDPNPFSAPSEITNPAHIRAVRQAFADWEAVSALQFTEITDGSDADIELFFDPIDGTGAVLGTAWTSFTVTGSPGTLEMITNAEIEFDPVEMASVDYEYFYLVALHEIGHTLGLDHVDDPTQVLYDFYPGDYTGPGAGDVAGLQELYGASSGSGSGFSFGDIRDETINTTADSTDTQIFGMGGNDTLRSGSGEDTLVGGTGDDQSFGNNGRDTIFDSFGDDTLNGGAGEDNLYSPDGQNKLDGGADNDALRGGIGNDTLIGGSGNDALIGDDQTASNLWFGDDRLDGGAGNDLLEGGSGRDVFVFSSNDGTNKIGNISFSTSSGFSILNNQPDFVIGDDRLDVSAYNFSSASQVLGKLKSSSEGAVFEASNTSVTLVGVDLNDLSISDFIW